MSINYYKNVIYLVFSDFFRKTKDNNIIYILRIVRYITMNIFSTCAGCGLEVEEGKYHTDQETGVPHCLVCCKTYFKDCPEKTPRDKIEIPQTLVLNKTPKGVLFMSLAWVRGKTHDDIDFQIASSLNHKVWYIRYKGIEYELELEYLLQELLQTVIKEVDE